MLTVNLEVDPISVFGWELDQISDDDRRLIAAKALYKVPTYFWTAPASASGKYHPKLSLGIGGLVRHVKAAFAIAEHLFRNITFCPFDDYQRDVIRIAILLHDSCKQGKEDIGTDTVKNHPLLPRTTVVPDSLSYDMMALWDDICNCIEPHMGQWNTDDNKQEILPLPLTDMQKIVHLADYMAAFRDMEIDVTRREAQHNYSHANAEPAWRQEDISKGQMDYITSLMNKAIKRGMSLEQLPHIDIKIEDLKKGQASDIILAYKALLGE